MVDLAEAFSPPAAPAFPIRFRAKHFDIPKNPLFSHLSRQQVRLLLPYIKQRKYRAGRVIFEEGARNPGKIYIVVSGQIGVTKQGISPIERCYLTYDIGELKRGDIFGEASFIDGKPTAVGYVARSDVTLVVVDLSALRLIRARRLHDIIVTKLRRYLASRSDDTLEHRLQCLRIENEFNAYRMGVGHIIITTLCLLSLYTLALNFLPAFNTVSNANFVASPLVILLFALSFVPIVATSGFPMRFFGLRFDNWKLALRFSLKASAAFLTALLALKWLLINSFSSFSDLSLFEGADIKVSGDAVSLTAWYWFALALYLVLTPMQEFVARSAIQAPLYAFLHGSENKRRWCSIVASNLVFAAAHAHISLAFALAAFLPGLLWGWIFARTNSLLAATVSHIIVGGVAIFGFGIEGLVSKLS